MTASGSRLFAALLPLALCCAPIGCSRKAAHASKPAGASAETTPSSPAPPAAEPEPERLACPSDMVLSEGLFCPEVEQDCLAFEPDGPDQPDRCLAYKSPSRCKSERREALRYCIDRFEWPNQLGKKPLVLVNWQEAQSLCASKGKRLCDDDEWLFACEGEQMLPYAYGYERDPTKCVLDRLYVTRTVTFKHYDECMASDECRAAFEKIDQREPSGSFKQCVSPVGAYDMIGNVNEWVNVPGETYPKRSGLKGGWWGPVRDRCRPTLKFHDEEYWGYEVGFRCCRNALP